MVLLIFILTFLACTIGLSTHALGIYTLVMCKKRNNQVLILSVLSISEICFLVTEILANIMLLRHHDTAVFNNSSTIPAFKQRIYPHAYQVVEAVLNHLVICAVNSMLIMLTLDRLFCVIWPLKYKILENKTTLCKLMAASAALSLLLGLLAISKRTILVSIITNFLMASFSLISFAATYTIIALKINKSNKISNSGRESISVRKKRKVFRNQYLVPCLVMTSYILLYFVPVCLVFYMKKKRLSDDVYRVYRVLWLVVDLGTISDPMIYILLVKSYREVIVKRLSCWRKERKPLLVQKMAKLTRTTLILTSGSLTTVWMRISLEMKRIERCLTR